MNTISTQKFAALHVMITDFLRENFSKKCRAFDREVIAPNSVLTTESVSMEMTTVACEVLEKYRNKGEDKKK